MPIRIIYLITAILLVSAFSTSCRKSRSDQPATTTTTATTSPTVKPPPYTYAIGGSRQWHDTAYTTYNGYGTDTLPHADATFAIDIIDSLHIKFQGTTLTYDSGSSTDSIGKYVLSTTDQNGSWYSYKLIYYTYSNHVTVSYSGMAGYSATSYEKWLSF